MKKLLKSKKIRKVEFKNNNFYVLNDVIKEITDSKNPKNYIQTLKLRNLDFSRCMTKCVTPLKIETKSGTQKMSCINFENLLKLIDFIPAKKISKFKNKVYKIDLLKIKELKNEWK